MQCTIKNTLKFAESNLFVFSIVFACIKKE